MDARPDQRIRRDVHPVSVVGMSSTCVFCDVIADRVAAHVVWRDDHVVAFLDRSPVFKGHVLVVPVRHVVTLPELEPDEVAPLFGRVRKIATAVPEACGAQGTFVAINNVVSQSVAHLHVHIVPRTKGDGLRGFFWPRTRYATGEAESVADELRVSISLQMQSER